MYIFGVGMYLYHAFNNVLEIAFVLNYLNVCILQPTLYMFLYSVACIFASACAVLHTMTVCDMGS